MQDDIIFHIGTYLPVIVLIQVLQTCKHLYKQRRAFIKNNEEYMRYASFDPRSGSYLSVYFLCDMIYENGRCIIKASMTNNHITAYNTYKLCAFYGTDSNIVKSYFAKKYIDIYGDDKRLDASVYANVFNRFMQLYDWKKYTEINIFNIYEILYHTKLRNIRRLAITLNKIIIYPVQDIDAFISIMGKLVRFCSIVNINHVNKTLIKASMFFVIYKFAEINKTFIPKSLVHTIINQSYDIDSDIMNTKTPLYFKNVIMKQIEKTRNSFME